MKEKPPDLLIVTALEEEFQALIPPFDPNLQILVNNNHLEYYFQEIPTTDNTDSYHVTVICLRAMGNTRAGIEVTKAITYLNPRSVIMFGIAGGIKAKVDKTDVIVPTQIFYHSLQKIEPQGIQTRLEVIPVSYSLLNAVQAFSLKMQDTVDYAVHTAPFFVGESVIASKNTVSELREIHPKGIGIEMESYGVGSAVLSCSSSTGFISIRGVSDFAEEDKNDEDRVKALQHASHFLLEFIKSGLLPHADDSKLNTSPYIAIHHLSLFRQTSIRQAIQTYLTELQEFDLIELTIDQTPHKVYEDMENALELQNATIERLENLLRENPNCRLGYFGLAYIPFMFHLGYHINRRNIELYGNVYGSAKWYLLPKVGNYPEVKIKGVPEHPITDTGDVVIRFSVSYQVYPHQTESIVDNPLADIHIVSSSIQLDIITSENALNYYVDAFIHVLQQIHRQIPNVQTVHVFASIQPTLAFKCGQRISHSIDPEIIIYNYSRHSEPQYSWGLNLQTGKIIKT